MALIYLKDWPQPIEAGRLRILEAALDAGVPYPHGCGSGECGSCKSRLIAGEVTLDAYSRDALSDAERASGVILACRARLKSDVTVQWLSATAPLPMVKLQARVQEIEHVSHDVVVLKLMLPQGTAFAFRPGQYAKLRMGRLPARSFSMANQPGEGLLEFHIRVLPDGMVSGYIAEQLQRGQSVEVRGPFGDAVWEDQPAHGEEPLLLLAGGTGLAPMVSVLDAALRSGVAGRQIHLYHGVRAERDLYARDHLQVRAQRQGFRFVPVFSDDLVRAARTGMLHEALAQDFASLAAARIFVAGPPPMVDAVKAQALELGAAPAHIRADGFYAAVPEKNSLWERVTAWGDL